MAKVQQKRAARTREKILAALEQLLESKEFEAISIADIARQGEVAVGSIYSHFEDKEALLDTMNAPGICQINALSPELHAGTDPRYGRPGRIPGSINVPAMSLVNPETKEIRPPGDVAAAFAGAGADPSQRIIAYCGGGIAASASSSPDSSATASRLRVSSCGTGGGSAAAGAGSEMPVSTSITSASSCRERFSWCTSTSSVARASSMILIWFIASV